MSNLNDFIRNIKNIPFKKDDEKKQNGENENIRNNYAIYNQLNDIDENLIQSIMANNKQNKTNNISIKESKDIKELDFYNLNKIKEEEQLVILKKQIVELQNKINELENKIKEKNNRIEELEFNSNKYYFFLSKYKELLIYLLKFTPLFKEQKEFIEIKIPLLNDKEFIDYFILCFKDLIQRYNTLIDQYNVLEEKFNQVIELRSKDLELYKTYLNNNLKEEIDNNNIFSNNHSIEDNFIKNNDKNNDIEDLLHLLNSDSIKIIQILGDTGISDFDDIKKIKEIADIFTNNNLKDLNKHNLIEDVILNLKVPGIFKKRIIYLTDTGKDLYSYLTNKKAIECEKDRVLREHSSLEHGYFIKLVKEEMEKQNYKVTAEFNKLKINIYNLNDKTQKRVEADLIAENESNNEVILIECEMDTTEENAMKRKVEKISFSLQELALKYVDKKIKCLFVLPNKEALANTLIKLENIKQDSLNINKSFIIYLTNFYDLKHKKEWQKFLIN